MLLKLKTLLGIPNTDQDELLGTLITMCCDDFMQLTHSDTIIENLVIDMVIFRFNRLGSEGVSQENYDRISNNFIDGYPADLYKRIVACRHIRTV